MRALWRLPNAIERGWAQSGVAHALLAQEKCGVDHLEELSIPTDRSHLVSLEKIPALPLRFLCASILTGYGVQAHANGPQRYVLAGGAAQRGKCIAIGGADLVLDGWVAPRLQQQERAGSSISSLGVEPALNSIMPSHCLASKIQRIGVHCVSARARRGVETRLCI